MLYDWTFILLIPAMILSLIAHFGVKRAYTKYSSIRVRSGLSGAQAARRILTDHDINSVSITQINGELTDHYDPRTEVISLSTGIADGSSIASVAVASHEAGHAVQHQTGYFLASLRTTMVPVVNFASSASFILVLIGLILASTGLAMLGVYLFAAVVVFQLVTLPVELDASRRAMVSLRGMNALDAEELKGARKMLTAAAMTYVAALFVSLMQLLRLFLLANRRR